MDLTTVNASLMILAAAALVQMAAMVLLVVWLRRTLRNATLMFDQEIRPVLARIGHAADVVESTGRGVGAASDDVRNVLSTVTHTATSVAPPLARAWLAARLLNWAVRKGVRRMAGTHMKGA